MDGKKAGINIITAFIKPTKRFQIMRLMDMAHKLTLEERKKHTKDFYPEKRKKFGIMAACIILILLICAALGWSIRSQFDIGLTLILTVALIVAVFASVFVLDVYFYETY